MEEATKQEKSKKRPATIMSAYIMAIATILAALIAGIFLLYNTSLTIRSISSPTAAPNNQQMPTEGFTLLPTQIVATNTQSPLITLTVIKNKKLSESQFVPNGWKPPFYQPPKDIIVNNKLLQSDIKFYGPPAVFKLDRQQKKLHIECGIIDHEEYSYELKIIGDGKELLIQDYKNGNDAIVNDIDIASVEILTFELNGRGSSSFGLYCKDDLIY